MQGIAANDAERGRFGARCAGGRADGRCGPGCYFSVRLGVFDPKAVPPYGLGRPHEWLDMSTRVDGVTNVHWYQDVLGGSTAWASDPH